MSSCFSKRRIPLLSRSNACGEGGAGRVGAVSPTLGEKNSLILNAEGLKLLLTLWNVFENKVLFMESGIFLPYHKI